MCRCVLSERPSLSHGERASFQTRDGCRVLSPAKRSAFRRSVQGRDDISEALFCLVRGLDGLPSPLRLLLALPAFWHQTPAFAAFLPGKVTVWTAASGPVQVFRQCPLVQGALAPKLGPPSFAGTPRRPDAGTEPCPPGGNVTPRVEAPRPASRERAVGRVFNPFQLGVLPLPSLLRSWVPYA